MDWWEDEFCTQLAAGSRFVIRYDNRDTGQSTSYPASSPTYGHPDLVADALGLSSIQIGSRHSSLCPPVLAVQAVPTTRTFRR